MSADPDDVGDAEMQVGQQLHDWYRQQQPPDGALDRAMARLAAEPRERVVPGLAPRWNPRRLSSGMRVAAALVLMVGTAAVLARSRVTPMDPLRTTSVDESGPRIVRFAIALGASEAKDVRIVGDFNGWDAKGVELSRNPRSGRWEGAVSLPPGLHHYTYLLDGVRWVIDPMSPSAGDELLGATNAIVVPGGH